jgi:quinol monooxygenase YgiN
MDTVVVTAVFTPAEGRREQLIEALTGAIPAVHAEEGCELFALHDAADGTIALVEKWTTVALLDAHAAGAPVKALDAAIADHIASKPVVTRLFPLPVGGAAGAL